MRAAILTLALAACARQMPPMATQVDAERAHVELAQLQEGRTLLVHKCGTCHQPPLPVAHGKIEWPKMLDEMATRSNLDTRQRSLILQYLVVMTDAPPPIAKR